MFWKTISFCLLMTTLAQANDVATAWNTFALDLYRHVSQEPGNLVIAPLGIAQTLAIHAAGSRGETQQELLKVQHLEQGFLADVEEHLKLLRRETDSKNWINVQSIWLHHQWKWKRTFEKEMKEVFDADLREFDLRRNRAVLSINKWIQLNSDNQFQNVVRRADLNDGEQWLSVNVQFFKGKWLHPFKERDTKPGPFWLSTEQEISVPTMLCRGNLKTKELENAYIVQMPYKDTSTCMVLVVPKERDDLAELMADIKLEDLLSTANNGVELHVSKLYLPKFQFQTRTSYRSNLRNMGVQQAFEETADFTPMFANERGPMFLGDIHQLAAVEVDEYGTTAKSATFGKGFGGGFRNGELRVDCPFFFLIHNRDSNSILFMGRVSDPSKH